MKEQLEQVLLNEQLKRLEGIMEVLDNDKRKELDDIINKIIRIEMDWGFVVGLNAYERKIRIDTINIIKRDFGKKDRKIEMLEELYYKQH